LRKAEDKKSVQIKIGERRRRNLEETGQGKFTFSTLNYRERRGKKGKRKARKARNKKKKKQKKKQNKAS